MQGPWVRFLGWELRSHMLCNTTKHLKNYYFLIHFPSGSLCNYKQFKRTFFTFFPSSYTNNTIRSTLFWCWFFSFLDILTVFPCQCREMFLTLFEQIYNILGWGWTRVYSMTLIDNFYIVSSLCYHKVCCREWFYVYMDYKFVAASLILHPHFKPIKSGILRVSSRHSHFYLCF